MSIDIMVLDSPETRPAKVMSPFTIGLTDRNGKPLPTSPAVDGFSDPSVHEARGIDFDVHLGQGTEPTLAEMARYRDLLQLEHALRELYPETNPVNEVRFRPYFIRLFYLATLILEGDLEKGPDGKKIVCKRLSDDAARAEVAQFAEELIDDEAPRVKNRHFLELSACAGKLSLAFLAAFVVLRLISSAPANAGSILLNKLEVDPAWAANVMLLWVGTFMGVCLSYAIRTQTFSVTDLTRTDSDYLTPRTRLLLTGTFAMLLTFLCIVGLGDIRIGSIGLSEIPSHPMLAVLVGAVLGISEQKLPGSVGKRASDLLSTATTQGPGG